MHLNGCHFYHLLIIISKWSITDLQSFRQSVNRLHLTVFWSTFSGLGKLKEEITATYFLSLAGWKSDKSGGRSRGTSFFWTAWKKLKRIYFLVCKMNCPYYFQLRKPHSIEKMCSVSDNYWISGTGWTSCCPVSYLVHHTQQPLQCLTGQLWYLTMFGTANLGVESWSESLFYLPIIRNQFLSTATIT